MRVIKQTRGAFYFSLIAASLLAGCGAEAGQDLQSEELGSSTEALTGDLLIDDFSSQEQYNTRHVNDLGGFTSDYNTMLSANVGSGLELKLQWDGTNDYWHSYFAANGCADVSSSATLTFKVRGLTGGETFGIGLVDGGAGCMSSNLHSVPLSKYTTITTAQQTVSIPLSDFGATLGAVRYVMFFGFPSTSGTAFIDDLKLEAAKPAPFVDFKVDDFSSPDQYNVQHKNDLGGETDDGRHLSSAYDVVDAAADLKLYFKEQTLPSNYWYSKLSPSGAAIDLSRAVYLTFRAKRQSSTYPFSVSLEDATHLVSVSTSAYVTLSSTYQTVRIPLTAFAGLDKSKLKSIQLSLFNQTQDVAIDDLKFELTPEPRLYVLDGAALGTPSTLSFTAGTAASTDTIPSADGRDGGGVPTDPLVYEARGINAVYDPSKATQLSLFLNAGTTVGLAPQARISYDVEGDGVFDKVELYNYFATDPIASTWENYTQAQGIQFETGHLSDMHNGTVRLEVWNRFRTGTAQIRTSATAATGQQSSFVIPFTR
jgi:hypothetical protein